MSVQLALMCYSMNHKVQKIYRKGVKSYLKLTSRVKGKIPIKRYITE